MEDSCCAITLVDIAVHDQDSLYTVLKLHQPGRDGSIIKHTETLAVIRESMMRPTGQIDRHPLTQGRPASRDCASHRTARAFQKIL